jgi:hypothetical protein
MNRIVVEQRVGEDGLLKCIGEASRYHASFFVFDRSIAARPGTGKDPHHSPTKLAPQPQNGLRLNWGHQNILGHDAHLQDLRSSFRRHHT